MRYTSYVKQRLLQYSTTLPCCFAAVGASAADPRNSKTAAAAAAVAAAARQGEARRGSAPRLRLWRAGWRAAGPAAVCGGPRLRLRSRKQEEVAAAGRLPWGRREALVVVSWNLGERTQLCSGGQGAQSAEAVLLIAATAAAAESELCFPPTSAPPHDRGSIYRTSYPYSTVRLLAEQSQIAALRERARFSCVETHLPPRLCSNRRPGSETELAVLFASRDMEPSTWIESLASSLCNVESAPPPNPFPPIGSGRKPRPSMLVIPPTAAPVFTPKAPAKPRTEQPPAVVPRKRVRQVDALPSPSRPAAALPERQAWCLDQILGHGESKDRKGKSTLSQVIKAGLSGDDARLHRGSSGTGLSRSSSGMLKVQQGASSEAMQSASAAWRMFVDALLSFGAASSMPARSCQQDTSMERSRSSATGFLEAAAHEARRLQNGECIAACWLSR